ncbi:MAG: hypothetical protein A3D18_02415 [Chlamydiae bacterium RIFCSPHIGHO2_02_FULL_49_29]|nr:MAG: hypothetical protein A3D18_02415 [Chlamydiae bacterium RIFCSPHIGHO2_02_FULL_49_29]
MYIADVDLLFAKSVLKYAPLAKKGAVEAISRALAGARQGHLCVRVEDVTLFPEEVVERVDRTSGPFAKPLCLFGDLLYLQKNWIFENRLLKELKRLSEPLPLLRLSDEAEDLTEEQRNAMQRAAGSSLSLITGGPGTGKTYMAARIIRAFLKENASFRLALAAPTGKAAAALEDALCGMGGSFPSARVATVHALLFLKPHSEEVEKKLPYDLILVDEASMLDARLFAALLASVQVGTRLILMGDSDQLPPVEAGSLFADLLDLGLFPCTRLTKWLRTESRPLLELARAIRDGDKAVALQLMRKESLQGDFGFSFLSVNQIHERIWSFVKERIPAHFSQRPTKEEIRQVLEGFRILSCLRTGPLGVDALNQKLVNQFYRTAPVGSYVAIPVLLTRSDSSRDLYNGQTGVFIKQKEERDGVLLTEKDEIVFAERTLPALAVAHFEYACCLSVHKSQGSEYAEVLLLVPKGSDNFGREVLYTAATRAKNQLWVVGDEATIEKALERSSRRQSGLIPNALQKLEFRLRQSLGVRRSHLAPYF